MRKDAAISHVRLGAFLPRLCSSGLSRIGNRPDEPRIGSTERLQFRCQTRLRPTALTLFVEAGVEDYPFVACQRDYQLSIICVVFSHISKSLDHFSSVMSAYEDSGFDSLLAS